MCVYDVREEKGGIIVKLRKEKSEREKWKENEREEERRDAKFFKKNDKKEER